MFDGVESCVCRVVSCALKSALTKALTKALTNQSQGINKQIAGHDGDGDGHGKKVLNYFKSLFFYSFLLIFV